MAFVNFIAQNAIDTETGNFDPIKVFIFFDLAVLRWYAGITFEDGDDLLDAYDDLDKYKVFDIVIEAIGDEEYTNRYGTCLGKNLMTVLNGTTDNYRPGMGDGENEPFQWIPVPEIRMYQWAFGQDKHIYNIINSL